MLHILKQHKFYSLYFAWFILSWSFRLHINLWILTELCIIGWSAPLLISVAVMCAVCSQHDTKIAGGAWGWPDPVEKPALTLARRPPGGSWAQPRLGELRAASHPYLPCPHNIVPKRACTDVSAFPLWSFALVKLMTGTRPVPLLSRLPSLPPGQHQTLTDVGLRCAAK